MREAPFVPSEQQRIILDAVLSSNDDIQVVARAGTGKSRTMIEAAKLVDADVLFLAFNKSIADELQNRVPRNVKVRTLHSYGFSILRAGFEKVNVDQDNVWSMINALTREHVETIEKLKETMPTQKWREISEREEIKKETRSMIKRIVSLAKNTYSDLSVEALQEVAEDPNYGCGLPDDESQRRIALEFSLKILEMCIPSSDVEEITIDYDDMVWLPHQCSWLDPPTYDFVFLDEAQDANRACHELVHKAISGGGRLCYVGDPRQSLYLFRAAVENSMDDLKQALEAQGRTVQTFPLTLTRRCPKNVVALAQVYVPDIEALPEAPEGKILWGNELGADVMFPSSGDAVLCRTNAPLVRLAFQLLKRKVPVRIKGRDIGQGIVELVESFNAYSIEVLLQRLDDYVDRERAKINKRHAKNEDKRLSALSNLQDRIEMVRSLAAEHNTPQELVNTCKRLFTDDIGENYVCLSSIHRFKGDERNDVYILDIGWAPDGPQEDNIRYVAITRAKRGLVFVRWEQTKPETVWTYASPPQ